MPQGLIEDVSSTVLYQSSPVTSSGGRICGLKATRQEIYT